MKIFKLTIKFKNDFHTSGDLKGSLNDFLKDRNGIPYIPATHIKGVIRTEAERLIRSIEKIECDITENKLCDKVKKGSYGCDVCRIFGAPDYSGENEYREGKIRITELKLDGKIKNVLKTHVTIDRNTQSNANKSLFTEIYVPSESEFSGYIFIKENLTDSENRLLNASIQSMKDYGLGKNRSRGAGGIKEFVLKEISLDEYEEAVK